MPNVGRAVVFRATGLHGRFRSLRLRCICSNHHTRENQCARRSPTGRQNWICATVDECNQRPYPNTRPSSPNSSPTSTPVPLKTNAARGSVLATPNDTRSNPSLSAKRKNNVHSHGLLEMNADRVYQDIKTYLLGECTESSGQSLEL